MADEEFGITEWGADWVHAAQARVSAVQRLPKARSLVRNEKVKVDQLVGSPISAAVDGEAVVVTLRPYTKVQLRRAERILAADTDREDYAAGDLSEAVHVGLTSAGLDPVPDSLEAECSCAARARPCVHVLATYYELSRLLDEQPRRALLLRGLAEHAPAAAEQAGQRWVALSELNPAEYYSAARGNAGDGARSG